MDRVVQPVNESSFNGSVFDRLPDGEFQVVVATPSGEAPRVLVSSKDRVKIDFEGGVSTSPETSKTAAPVPAPQSRLIGSVLLNKILTSAM